MDEYDTPVFEYNDDELVEEHPDRLIDALQAIIRFAVRLLAILMTFVILWGIGDVAYVLYQRLMQPPFFLLNINNIFETFGAFLTVLIGIEIFMNIRLYLGRHASPLRFVLATALMAVARKVIILDTETLTSSSILGIAAIVLALGVTYYLVTAGRIQWRSGVDAGSRKAPRIHTE